MKGKRFAGAVCLASVLIIGSQGTQTARAFASSSNAATNGALHCDPSSPQCGFGPDMPINPALVGPAPSFVTVGQNCPSFISTDAWTLNFVSGNAVLHFTVNNNGDWNGFTAEGQAALATSDFSVPFMGHLQLWADGGNNSAGQTVNGLTVNFNGSGPDGSISIHSNLHFTTNNAGTTTAAVTSGSITCS